MTKNLPPGLVAPEDELPTVLLCFKKSSKNKSALGSGPEAAKNNGDQSDDDKIKRKRRRAKSRELRNGILLVGCDCERRNGLQDQCPRSGCQGAPECMEIPPTCEPSEFAQGKHIAKYYEQLLKEREEFANKMSEKVINSRQGGDKSGSDNKQKKADYDCFPLDQLMEDGQPCPLCKNTIENSNGKQYHSHDNCQPIVIDFTSDCLCSASG